MSTYSNKLSPHIASLHGNKTWPSALLEGEPGKEKKFLTKKNRFVDVV